MDGTRKGPIATTWCPIVELRQYALHPGGRDDLIDLFDAEFIEPQEAVGLTVMGQFRDLDLAGFLRSEPETHRRVPTARSRLPAMAAIGSTR